MTGEAFAQAVQTYGDTVYRVAFHALNSREDAEDVMQTVMLKLFEYDKEFESEAHLKHWLLERLAGGAAHEALLLAARFRPFG